MKKLLVLLVAFLAFFGFAPAEARFLTGGEYKEPPVVHVESIFGDELEFVWDKTKQNEHAEALRQFVKTKGSLDSDKTLITIAFRGGYFETLLQKDTEDISGIRFDSSLACGLRSKKMFFPRWIDYKDYGYDIWNVEIYEATGDYYQSPPRKLLDLLHTYQAHGAYGPVNVRLYRAMTEWVEKERRAYAATLEFCIKHPKTMEEILPIEKDLEQIIQGL